MMDFLQPNSMPPIMHMQAKRISKDDGAEYEEVRKNQVVEDGDSDSMVTLEQFMHPIEKSPEILVQVMQDSNVRKERRNAIRRRRTERESGEDGEGNGGEESEEHHEYIPVPDSSKRKRRGAICCDTPLRVSSASVLPRPFVPKSPEVRDSLEKVLTRNIMFKHLDEEQISQISNAMYQVHFKASDIVFRQGDEGDTFFVVERGECDVYMFNNTEGLSLHVATYASESAFGELALIYGSPRASTVKAKTDLRLWAIDRAPFRAIVMETTMNARKIYEAFLEKVPILAHLTKYERATMADNLQTSYFYNNEVIVRQGDPGDNFYIIVEGGVEITHKGGVKVGMLGVSDYFGEIALLTNQPRSATITSVGDTKCIYLDRDSFNRLLGPIEDILRRNMVMYNQYISNTS